MNKQEREVARALCITKGLCGTCDKLKKNLKCRDAGTCSHDGKRHDLMDTCEFWADKVLERPFLAQVLDHLDAQEREIAGLRRNSYPHMCRMDHLQIGHSDSGDDERCPLCQANDEISYLRDVIEGCKRLNQEHHVVLVEISRQMKTRMEDNIELVEMARALREMVGIWSEHLDHCVNQLEETIKEKG